MPDRGMSRRLVLLLPSVAAVAACSPDHGLPAASADALTAASTSPEASVAGAPTRFTIRPDDYHVPYAGTAEDGRKFFLSNELFDSGTGWVGLYLWKADGTFDEVKVEAVGRAEGVPPGQAAASGDDVTRKRLDELGDYTLEPISVEPFMTKVHGTEFGWHVGHYDDGTVYVNIEPGDFICYYAPWDGYVYDT
ncbi:hypothetical protein ACIB24_04180 [Spongisporangium articulatum]|uniref:Uncharacterized protein n=1 Tax=Spongisporangium articulatum TaxID=3362603 RepID=A0ABW8AKV3_9ACTN